MKSFRIILEQKYKDIAKKNRSDLKDQDFLKPLQITIFVSPLPLHFRQQFVTYVFLQLFLYKLFVSNQLKIKRKMRIAFILFYKNNWWHFIPPHQSQASRWYRAAPLAFLVFPSLCFPLSQFVKCDIR